MLRRTYQSLPRRQLLTPYPRCLSTTPKHDATPLRRGLGQIWDKVSGQNQESPLPPGLAETWWKVANAPPEGPQPYRVRGGSVRSDPDGQHYIVETRPEEAPRDQRACTVLTSHPQTTSLQELLDAVPQFPHPGQPDRADFVLLVTPTYASSLHKQKHVIERALARIFPLNGLKEPAEALSLVAAVVDRLPSPSSFNTSPIGDTGSEGIALMLPDDFESLQPPEVSENPRAEIPADNATRFLTFDFEAQTRECDGPMTRGIQVPLANTIFQNGLPATLVWRKWLVQPGGQSIKETEDKLCDRHRVPLPFWPYGYRLSDFAMSLPLVPLTPARSVVACMGNIIRRLSSNAGLIPEDGSREAILASHELEHSVTSYHKSRDLSPRPVSVWALVIPEKTFSGGLSMAARALQPKDLAEAWKSDIAEDAKSSSPNLLTLLQHGARLHKVLSGGGGWGKKAGLLSLDPNSDYGMHESAHQSQMREIGAQPEDMRNIVSKGDFIQFFISPSASLEETPTKSDSIGQQLIQRASNVRSAEFGTIPSTVDNLPSTQEATSAASKTIQVHQNHFGALSEKGIALFCGERPPFDAPPYSEPTTKVDVPFGRFKYQTQISESVAESSVGESAKVGQGFAPTKPLKSSMSRNILSWQELAEQRDHRPILQRQAFHIHHTSLDNHATPLTKDEQSSTKWQSASRDAVTSRELKKLERVPRRPNKNWSSKDINEARKATRGVKKAKTEAEASTTSPDHDISSPEEPTDLASLYAESLETGKVRVWAQQSMEDVISPEAFKDLTEQKSIPKHPNSHWTCKDIRAAFTFLKRQRSKKQELARARSKRANTVTEFRKLDMRSEDKKSWKPRRNAIGKGEKSDQSTDDPPVIEALKQQAKDRVRTRMLRTAFRGLLSPSKQRRSLAREAARAQNTEYHVSDPVLTQRVMHLLTVRESLPRITVYELMDIHRFPYNEEMDLAVRKEKMAVRKEELLQELLGWRNAAQNLRQAIDEKYPAPGKKSGWKRVAEEEIQEVERVEQTVNQFLSG